MPQFWEAKEVLDLCSDQRCVGIVPSTSRKCRRPISWLNQARMNILLIEISSQSPDLSILRPKLMRLAGYSLCVRCQQTQIDGMVEEWTRKIHAAYPESETARVAPSTTSHSTPSTTISRTPTLESTRSSRRLTATTTISSMPSLPSLPELIALQERLRTAQRRLQEMRNTRFSNDILLVSRVSISGPPTASPSSRSRHCNLTPVRRRSLDEECSICYDNAPLSHTPSELVWCKFGCGRSVHRECFKAWQNQCVTRNREVTCIICRENWVDGCE
ncbi:uncharacterized protein K460DRAFT_367028 [Cucurbitaria berberidis CBS 394.84]|uniref:RING-type domain-containing protein n=1 Tax=Cucurbitaria berberidis CBS 394.84 TaxID=1168544 RepID=A0A9P4GIE3_9PLEO|nr:uncharacterized protein K460DRAFT_367028 [Cucurbitaria berberidis CBS 394.84]KAF1846212.1 hypothetical protein K460DRAFT_367028 [Cucurbitaria berberidis CBS 394.84]